MNGYHKAEDRAKMIAAGIDPDAPTNLIDEISPFVVIASLFSLVAIMVYENLFL